MVRGYGRIRDTESMVSDDDNSEDDIDDTLVYNFTANYLFRISCNKIVNTKIFMVPFCLMF